MRRIGVLALFLLLIVLPAASQETPKAEIFAGYSYSHTAGGAGLSGINLNGWTGSLTGNFNSWLGVTGDFGGYYGSTSGTGVNRYSFLFGPKLTYRGESKVNPFAHALFGGVRAHRDATPPVPIVAAASETAFGMVFGGGVDYQVNDRFSVRFIQADYVLTRFTESSGIVCIQSITVPCTAGQAGTQSNVRLSFGIVFRLGKR